MFLTFFLWGSWGVAITGLAVGMQSVVVPILAIAGIVITLINIVCGFAIGVLEAGMTIAESGSVYTKLTIGDGLVSQVPALLISIAAGLLVTRSAQRTNLPTQFLQQLFVFRIQADHLWNQIPEMGYP